LTRPVAGQPGTTLCESINKGVKDDRVFGSDTKCKVLGDILKSAHELKDSTALISTVNEVQGKLTVAEV